jgi:hypothetical protein
MGRAHHNIQYQSHVTATVSMWVLLTCKDLQFTNSGDGLVYNGKVFIPH